MTPPRSPGGAATMRMLTREEFRANPSEAARIAREDGDVGILDSDGKLSLTISGQRELLPEDAEIERLRARIAELEDTVRLENATRWMHSSSGRDEIANLMLADIEARRGKGWAGALVSKEPDPKEPR